MRVSEDRRALLGLLGFGVFFFWRPLLGDQLFMRDITVVWYPLVSAFISSIAAGSWPVWDPYRGFGKPLLADPNGMVLYPFTWLNLLLPLHTYYTVFATTHLVGSAWGIYFLARRWHLSPLAAFSAGVVWAGSGPFLSTADLWHHFAGAAWMPWVFWSGERACEQPTLRRILAWGSIMAGQILAGSADMVALTGLGLLVHLAAQYGDWRKPFGRENRLLLLRGTGALGVALGLSAAQWLPTLSVALDSARWSLPGADRTMWSLHALGLLEVLFPFSFRRLPPIFLNTNLFYDLQANLLYSLYLGIPAATLALAAFTSRSTRSGGLLALAIGTILVAMGRHGWVYSLLVQILPPLRMIRYPVKAMVLVGFCWSLLVGLGVEAWGRPDETTRRRLVWRVLAPVVALTLMAWAGTWFAFSAAGSSLLQAAAAPTGARLLTGACLASMSVALCLARLKATAWSRRLAAGATALVILDLGWAHSGLHRVAPADLLAGRTALLDVLEKTEHLRVYVYDYVNKTPKERFGALRTEGYRLQTIPAGLTPPSAWLLGMHMHLFPPTATLHGIYGSYDMDMLGLYPRHLKELTEFLRDSAENTPLHLRLLQMGSVQNVIALHRDRWWQDLAPVGTFPGPFEQPFQVFRVPDPLPWSYVVEGVRVADGPEAFAVLSDPGFDPRRELILPAGREATPGEGFRATSQVLERRPDGVRIEATANRPAYLVLVDAFYPGWRATLDGSSVPVLRANIGFRAVSMPAGRHRIEMTYRPAPLLWGSGISILTSILTIAGLLHGTRVGANG